jgi:hypothetical protein
MIRREGMHDGGKVVLFAESVGDERAGGPSMAAHVRQDRAKSRLG